MPTPTRGARLGSGPAHQRLLLANLAADLFTHGRITTTEAKAKALRPYAEKLITKAKRGDMHARRQVLSKITDRDIVAYLFEDVGPRFVDRNGGYTRIVKLGPRKGDGARMALIELVDQGEGTGSEQIEESKSRRSRGIFGRRRRQQESAPAFDPDELDLSEVDDEAVEAAEDVADQPDAAAGSDVENADRDEDED